MKETVEFNTLFIMVTGEIYCKITLCIKLAGVPSVSQVKVLFTPAFYPRLVFWRGNTLYTNAKFFEIFTKNCRLFLKMHQYSNRKIHKKMRNLRLKYGALHAGFKAKFFKEGSELTTNLRLLYGGRRF